MASKTLTAPKSKAKEKAASVKGKPAKAESKEPTKVKRDANTDEARVARTVLRQVNAETLNEKKLLNDFQQQKERIDKFSAMEKQTRDELKMSLRDKLRQKQDLEEKQAFELKIYKEKVKHLLHEQETAMADIHIDNQVALKLQQDDQRSKQHEQKKDIRSVKVVDKDRERQHYDLINGIRQEHEERIVKLRQEFERRADELKNNYEKKMRTVREEYDERRKEDTNKIEQRKAKHISKLTARHKKAFEDIKKYYTAITHANLELIVSLKTDVFNMKREDDEKKAQLNEAKRRNKKLSRPLQSALKEIEELQADLVRYTQDKVVLASATKQLGVLEERSKNLSWEHEILVQKFGKLAGERDELKDKLETTIYDVQQKTGFRNLLLEKKIESVKQDVEKTESALGEVLASTNLKPEVLGNIQHNLEDVLLAKNKQVQRLEDTLGTLRQAYADTIQKYEGKLQQYRIPPEELGFTPIRAV